MYKVFLISIVSMFCTSCVCRPFVRNVKVEVFPGIVETAQIIETEMSS